jgi:hypothetical protein
MGAPEGARCAMVDTCAEPVAMVDQKGYLYCAGHGLQRRAYRPCRKLRPHELQAVARGELVKRY